MMRRPKVCVLMSTYNGDKYVQEQIDSILAQKDVDIILQIRDDGSVDGTVSILKKNARKHDNINLYLGHNVGVGRSFLHLLQKAPSADYYAFADQDDVWLETKLARAVDVIRRVSSMKDLQDHAGKGITLSAGAPDISGDLSGELQKDSGSSGDGLPEISCRVPVLYGSNQTLVDKDLQYISLRLEEMPDCDLMDSIRKNEIYGCTMVMNQALRSLCSNVRMPGRKTLTRKNHDAWVLYCAQITGVFVFDQESHILYRQHENNVVGGMKLRGFQIVADKYKRLKTAKNKRVRSNLARELLARFDMVMDPEVKQHLNILKNANSPAGIFRLLKDETVRESFHEKKAMILLRGLFQWI